MLSGARSFAPRNDHASLQSIGFVRVDERRGSSSEAATASTGKSLTRMPKQSGVPLLDAYFGCGSQRLSNPRRRRRRSICSAAARLLAANGDGCGCRRFAAQRAQNIAILNAQKLCAFKQRIRTLVLQFGAVW